MTDTPENRKELTRMFHAAVKEERELMEDWRV